VVTRKISNNKAARVLGRDKRCGNNLACIRNKEDFIDPKTAKLWETANLAMTALLQHLEGELLPNTQNKEPRKKKTFKEWLIHSKGIYIEELTNEELESYYKEFHE
jgi:hypothetical protein